MSMTKDQARPDYGNVANNEQNSFGVPIDESVQAAEPNDPLAELIRMVKRDDPFAEVLQSLNNQTTEINESVDQQITEGHVIAPVEETNNDPKPYQFQRAGVTEPEIQTDTSQNVTPVRSNEVEANSVSVNKTEVPSLSSLNIIQEEPRVVEPVPNETANTIVNTPQAFEAPKIDLTPQKVDTQSFDSANVMPIRGLDIKPDASTRLSVPEIDDKDTLSDYRIEPQFVTESASPAPVSTQQIIEEPQIEPPQFLDRREQTAAQSVQYADQQVIDPQSVNTPTVSHEQPDNLHEQVAVDQQQAIQRSLEQIQAAESHFRVNADEYREFYEQEYQTGELYTQEVQPETGTEQINTTVDANVYDQHLTDAVNHYDNQGADYQSDSMPHVPAEESANQQLSDSEILTHALGASVDQTEESFEEEDGPKRRKGAYFALGAFVGVAVLGGAFLFAYSQTSSRTNATQAPTLRADSGPVKVAPEQPGGQKINNQNTLVLDRGNENSQLSQERLISREERVVELPKGDAKDDSRLALDANGNPPAVQPNSPNASTQVNGAGQTTNAVAEIAPQPRRVRTVQVLPDGSIVETAAQPTQIAAVNSGQNLTQNVLQTPTNEVSAATNNPVPVPSLRPAYSPPAASRNVTSNTVQAQTIQPQNIPTPTAVVTNSQRSIVSVPQNLQGQIAGSQIQSAPVAPVQRNPGRENNVIVTPTNNQPILQRQPQNTVNTVQQATVAAAPQAGGYVIQLAARRSQQQAEITRNELSSRFTQLNRYQPLIQRADLGDRGIYYRVRYGTFGSQAEANAFCRNLQSSGLSDCLVKRQ